ncbi:hypothetical protein J2802_003063 [Paraburkholderia caribensis]|nr:hypothetical protein [Paraburkholderia caribensis]
MVPYGAMTFYASRRDAPQLGDQFRQGQIAASQGAAAVRIDGNVTHL